MADRFFLKCMGYPELRGPDGRAVRVKVRKHLAVLVYLAVEGRAQVSRDVLVDLLWGTAPPRDGRHSLSTALSFLRAVLGRNALEGGVTSIRFDRKSVTLDLDAIGRGDAGGNGPAELLAEDSFLADFSVPDAPAFLHWRDGIQARLQPALQRGLVQRIDEARRTSDVQGLLTCGNRLLALDPLSEDGVRARIEAHALSGDRLAALRLFEDWKATLHEELGARPSALMEGLAQRLRRNGVDRAVAPMVTLKREKWIDRAFIGRADEFQALFEAWESTMQLHTRHVVIEGESGIGKSTLAQRFLTAVELEGAACARVQCFELEQRIPFGMIGSLVSTLIDRPGAAGTDPAALAELARLVGRVREQFPRLPPPRPVEGEAARVLFAEGFFSLLESLMDEQPVVLVVDDYPRSDEASLSVLHMLLRRTALDRVMVVLTARPAEPGEPAQAQRIRKGVASLALRHLTLGPLEDAESNALLDALVSPTGRWLKPPERRAILRAAAGNPMAIELLAQDWIAHGDAAVVLSLPAMQADVPATAFDVTAYDRAVDRLVPSLTRRGRAALWIATVLGPRLNDLNFFRLVDLKDRTLITALAELTACRILREVGNKLEFSNELMRARLYLQVPSGVRTKLHEQVADRLIAADREGRDVSGLEIAWHCVRARRPAVATPYLMSGARKAIGSGASDEAARALSTALKHLKGRDRDEGIILLAETLQEMADWKGSLEVLEEIERKRTMDPELAEFRDALTVTNKLRLGIFSGRERLTMVRPMIDKVSDVRSAEAGLRVALAAARIIQELRCYEHGASLLAGLDRYVESELTPRYKAVLNLVKAMCTYYSGSRKECLTLLSTSIESLDEWHGADSTAVSLYLGFGVVAISLGLYEAARTTSMRALALSKRLDNDWYASTAGANLALCHLRLGEYDECRGAARVAAHKASRQQYGEYDLMRSEYYIGLASILLAKRPDAEIAMRELCAAIDRADLPWMEQKGRFFHADLAWALGSHRAALSIARESLRAFKTPLTHSSLGPWSRWTALVGIKDRNPAEAADKILQEREKHAMVDALDEAELALAVAKLYSTLCRPNDSFQESARNRLAVLPIPVSAQLSHLGVLDGCSPQPAPKALLRSKRRSGLDADRRPKRSGGLLGQEHAVRQEAPDCH